MSRLIFISAFFFSFLHSGKTDGADTLDIVSYLDLVLTHHPLIQKAQLYDDIRDAYFLKSKGALDPKVMSDYTRKYFDETDYFTIWQTEAKIPTRWPVDFSIGMERNDGTYLNQENTVPSNGLIYGSINLSLLRGLIYDEQRYHIQMAELNGLKSEIEKELLVREILHQALLTYIEWTQRDNDYNTNQDYYALVQIRHQKVTELYDNGDIPAIDTIESRLNLNSANKLLLKANDQLIKSLQKVSLFVWDNEGNPMQLNQNITPMTIEALVAEVEELSTVINPRLQDDPLIRKIDNQTQSLELNYKLEKENLKPQLDLKYNALINLGKDAWNPSISINDYKYGISFLYPILNRKTKGELRLQESFIAQNDYDKKQYLGKLSATYQSLLLRKTINQEQLLIAQEKLSNSTLLYQAEEIKFDLGESSIFLLNQRERKLLESRLELIKNYSDLSKVLAELYYIRLGQL